MDNTHTDTCRINVLHLINIKRSKASMPGNLIYLCENMIYPALLIFCSHFLTLQTNIKVVNSVGAFTAVVSSQYIICFYYRKHMKNVSVLIRVKLYKVLHFFILPWQQVLANTLLFFIYIYFLNWSSFYQEGPIEIRHLFFQGVLDWWEQMEIKSCITYKQRWHLHIKTLKSNYDAVANWVMFRV